MTKDTFSQRLRQVASLCRNIYEGAPNVHVTKKIKDVRGGYVMRRKTVAEENGC